MDLKMDVEHQTDDAPVWDVKTEEGIVPIIMNDDEDVQCATLACFLERGAIPQLSSVGVDWAGFLTGGKTFGELDSEIRQSLRLAGMEEFQPDYQIVGDKLTLQVKREIR
jgi:hypothetical protein